MTCDGCRASPLVGTRWKCSQCYDFDLCFSCYMSNQHSESHKFVRYDTGQLRYGLFCMSSSPFATSTAFLCFLNRLLIILSEHVLGAGKQAELVYDDLALTKFRILF